ncbi:MAG: hypothetical protein AVDCRST_MAG64-2216, partial [uncultured Phycisphaerae bacterium]
WNDPIPPVPITPNRTCCWVPSAMGRVLRGTAGKSGRRSDLRGSRPTRVLN